MEGEDEELSELLDRIEEKRQFKSYELRRWRRLGSKLQEMI